MGKLNGGMFSTNKATWETPQDLFDRLNAEFGFTLDVCADEHNHKCDWYYTEEVDGLRMEWGPFFCWMNPPYGREIGKWVEKAYHEARDNGAVVVCLLPARTDTAWWHDYCMKASEIRLVRGRLQFVGAPSPAPFPSAIVIFDGDGGQLGGPPVFRSMKAK